MGKNNPWLNPIKLYKINSFHGMYLTIFYRHRFKTVKTLMQSLIVIGWANICLGAGFREIVEHLYLFLRKLFRIIFWAEKIVSFDVWQLGIFRQK